MKRGLLMTGGAIILGSIGWLIYRKAKLEKQKKNAEQSGFSCGGCVDKSIKCTKTDSSEAIYIPCSWFPFGL
jgi:hypothetical protein